MHTNCLQSIYNSLPPKDLCNVIFLQNVDALQILSSNVRPFVKATNLDEIREINLLFLPTIHVTNWKWNIIFGSGSSSVSRFEIVRHKPGKDFDMETRFSSILFQWNDTKTKHRHVRWFFHNKSNCEAQGKGIGSTQEVT